MLNAVPAFILEYVHPKLPPQPVDATPALNLSTGRGFPTLLH